MISMVVRDNAVSDFSHPNLLRNLDLEYDWFWSIFHCAWNTEIIETVLCGRWR